MPINPNINELVFDTIYRKNTTTGYVRGVAVDTAGSFYIVELIMPSVGDPSSNGGTSFTVTKYDVNNTQVWSTTTTTSRSSSITSGTGVVFINGIAVDMSGCTYIYGVSQWANIGTVFSSSDSTEVFIIKFTNTGTIAWANKIDVTTWSRSNEIYDLKIHNNTIVLCGYLGSRMIRKYSLSGTLLSSFIFSETTYPNPVSLSMDLSNNIYVNGYFADGSNKKFINKYSWNLEKSWSITLPGTSTNGFATRCSISPDSEYVYVAVSYLMPYESFKAFVIKYTKEGEKLWETAAIVQGGSSGYDLYITCDNTFIYILTSNNDSKNYMIKLDSTGVIKSSLELGTVSSMGWPANICMDTTRYTVFLSLNAAYKYIPDYFKIVKDFNALYTSTLPYIDTSLLAANTKTVLSYINSSGAATAAWTALADKSTILTTGETAYIDLAKAVTAAYRAGYAAVTTAISGFTLTDAAAVTASTVAPADPTEYTAANSQLQLYVPQNLWATVGAGLATSTDGTSWTTVSPSPFGSGLGLGIAWNGSRWVAVGSGGMATSTDGTTWTTLTTNPFGSGIAGNAVAWNGSMWIAVCASSVTIKSTDGINWSIISPNPLGTGVGNGIAWNGSMWMIVGAGNRMATSTDGTTWTAVSGHPFGTGSGNGIAWNGSMWVAVGATGIARSNNGSTWTAISPNPFGTRSGNGIAWNGSMWVAVGATGIATSTDATTWTTVSPNPFGTSGTGNGIAWNGSMWVAGGSIGLITSTNGTTWTSVSSQPFTGDRIRIAAGLTNSYITSFLAELKNKVASMMASYLVTKASATIAIPAKFLLDPTVDQPNIDLMNGPPFIVTVNSNTTSNLVPALTGLTTDISGYWDPTKNGRYIVTGDYKIYNGDGSYVASGNSNTIQIPSPKRLIGYFIQNMGISGNVGQATTFTIEGSNDGTTWTSLEKFSLTVFYFSLTNGSSKTFAAPTKAFMYYRVSSDINYALTRIFLYEYLGVAADTRQDQLIQIYNKYKTAHDGILALAYVATFKTVYEAARRFINDDTLATTTIQLRQKLYTGTGDYTLNEIITARQDIMKTLITRYFLLNPSGSTATLAPSVLPSSPPSTSAIVPAPSTVTSETTASELTALETTYLTGSSALWPTLLDRIRSSVSNYIGNYKTTRDSGGITSGTNFYADSVCNTDISGIAASNFTRVIDTSGNVSYTVRTPSSTATSEYSYISDIYAKYALATDGILADVRQNAESARSSFQTMYETTLLNCRPVSTGGTDLQTAIANYAGDQALITSAATIASANSYRDLYRAGIAALFLQVRSDQLAIADKYIKLYNKYGSFRTNSAITSYGVSLAIAPADTVPDASTARAGIAGLPTTVSATSLPTDTQIGTLQTFCTNYGGDSGHYAKLVEHIRTNLLAFIIAYDRKWNALSADVKRNYSYTSPVTGSAFTATPSDADLYDYMNQYTGSVRDTLTSTTAAAPTTSYTSTISTATTQADALAQMLDFSAIYLAVRDVLAAKTDSRMTGITNMIGSSTAANTITKLLGDITSTNTATSSAGLAAAVTLVASSAFTAARTDLIALAQDNLNELLKEYRAVYSAYTDFRTAFSGIAELPTCDPIDASTAAELSGDADISGLAYTAPTSGNYTVTNVSGLDVYGSLQNYADFASYVSQNADKLQGLVSAVQQRVGGFRNSVSTRITGLATNIATDSAVGDAYSDSYTKSGTLRSGIANLSGEIVTWFMKEYWVNTWIVGRRYLSDAHITAAMTGFGDKCQLYITSAGTLKNGGSFALLDSDTVSSLMGSAATAMRDSSVGLATAYNIAWGTWVTTRGVATTAANPVAADTTAGTDAVRTKYLNAWPTLLSSIQSATRTKVTESKELQDWLRGTGTKTVRGVQTIGLGQQ